MVELIASYWTLAGGAEPHTDHEFSLFDFKDRVEACAKVGFKGIGIWHATWSIPSSAGPFRKSSASSRTTA